MKITKYPKLWWELITYLREINTITAVEIPDNLSSRISSSSPHSYYVVERWSVVFFFPSYIICDDLAVAGFITKREHFLRTVEASMMITFCDCKKRR